MFSEISLVAWMSGAIVFAIGGGAGFYIARQIKDKHTLGLEKQLETTQNQLNEYQGEVNRHFLKTSLLFNKLTDDYREVYEHLATGAQKLCNDKSLATTLDLPEAKILAAALTTEDAKHADTTQPDAETIVATEATTETTAHENTGQPKETVVVEQAAAEQTHTESSAAESSITETTPTAVEATPTITEEELKTLEATEQKKDTDEDIHLGAESTPSVKLEHHKTHPAIH